MDFYCVKCKCQHICINITPIITSNNKHAFRGNCSNCKTVLIRFAKKSEVSSG